MNLQNVKQKLDKVNRFFSYLEANEEVVSRVDRDSLLTSIRELYDACFDESTAKEVVVTKVIEKVVEVPVEKTTTSQSTDTAQENTPDTKKRPKLVFNTTSETETTQEVKKEVPVVSKEEPVVKKEVVEETPKQEPVIAKVETPVSTEDNSTEHNTPADGFNEEYDELFLFKIATDLSQKLSESPIEDLNKALGLNEKFLYINELYGGDVAKFQASIKVLNDGKNFDSARTHIETDLIATYNWMNKAKKAIAKDFVKLIRRRYL